MFFVETKRLNVELWGLDLVLDIEVYRNNSVVLEDMVLSRVKLHLPTSDIKTFNELVPASAWDHFKKDYFPKFLLKKYPVKYKAIVFSCKEIFPEYIPLIKTYGPRYLDVQYIVKNYSDLYLNLDTPNTTSD